MIPGTEAESAYWLALDREAQYQNHLDSMARQDALRAIARDIPDPEDYAYHLPLWAADALLAATKHSSYGWRVPRRLALRLRPYGLVAYNDDGLTAFGWAVRCALKRQDA